jgi:hypothetical protein
VSAGAIIAERFAAQALVGEPLGDPVAVAERLLAVQGQDPRGFRLAVRARTRRLTAADVDKELSEERSLVVGWLNRGTLHLVRGEDYLWLHALTTPPLITANARRLREEGVSPAAAERGVAAIERALAEEGPLTRLQLRDKIDAAGVRTAGQASLHLLMLACLRGIAVRGPMAGKEHAYALVRDWLGRPKPVDRDLALAELARRYLAGHGPANDRDLAKWAGLPLRDARAGFSAIGSELEERSDGLLALAKRPLAQAKSPTAKAQRPPPRLLGAFDPVLLGWTSREAILEPHASKVVSGGIFRPFAIAGGRAVGIWKLVKGKVELQPFERISKKTSTALEAEAADVERFFGGSS